jgi:hypothetical protein
MKNVLKNPANPLIMLIMVLTMAFTISSCTSSKTQTASAAGFETVKTPATELEEIKRDMESKFIPCGIGIGESSDEMVARNISADEARSDMARTMSALVQRLSESYAQNVSGEAKKIWEEGVKQLTDQELNGTVSYKVVTQFNKETNHFKMYSLFVMNPDLFKKAVADASAKQEEFELRVKKDDMMSKLSAGVAEYEAKYKK